jgi:sirohydrochlorin cobaltochelatase
VAQNRPGGKPPVSHDALLLIAHGSERYPNADWAVLRHAEALRAEGGFRQVEAAFLNGAPSVAGALEAIDAGIVRVVPFFMEAGYFTKVAIPAAVAGDRRVRIGLPAGVHPGMAGVVTRQAMAGCERLGLGPSDVALVVAGHGSASNPGRNLALYQHVAAIRGFGRVAAACLEEAPFLADVLAAMRGSAVLVSGFFAGDGMHVRDDVPDACRAAGAVFLGAVGAEPGMLDMVRDHAMLAAG